MNRRQDDPSDSQSYPYNYPTRHGRRRHRQQGARSTGAAAAAESGTALQALLAPEYDIIHVAGDVVAGFVGACCA
jgi:hypothetical protein